RSERRLVELEQAIAEHRGVRAERKRVALLERSLLDLRLLPGDAPFDCVEERRRNRHRMLERAARALLRVLPFLPDDEDVRECARTAAARGENVRDVLVFVIGNRQLERVRIARAPDDLAERTVLFAVLRIRRGTRAAGRGCAAPVVELGT